MKLLRVELRDFRCFGEARFDLCHDGEPLDVVLLVGDNGSGKTSVLHAISGLLTQLAGEYGADPPALADVRDGAEEAQITLRWRDLVGDRMEQLEIGACISRTAGRRPAGISFANAQGPLEPWRQQVVDESRRSTGMIVAFDSHRILPTERLAGPNIANVPTRRCVQSMTPTVRRQGGLERRFALLKQWIVNLDFLRAKAKADRNLELPLWDTLRSGLDALLSPYTFERVDDRFEVLMSSPTGIVPIEALSEGHRSVFVIVGELLFRLSLCTSSPGRVLEQEGVCLIDEIDLHLHPRWQESVLPGLRTLFPNVQFIATTHSDLVMASVRPHNIFRLEVT
jgi:energy-coupling factor transporter ATP-binding protein EcfA2